MELGGVAGIVESAFVPLSETPEVREIITCALSAAVDRGEGIGCGDTGDVSVVATGSPALVVKDI